MHSGKRSITVRILKEPLFHFVVIGGLLFALYAAFGDKSEVSLDSREVVVPAGRLAQISTIFEKTWQRPPTRSELEGLVNDYIIEEIYYREATAAGLDKNDTLIRRRLRQKMEFLTEDVAIGQPGDPVLREFVSEHPDRFRTPSFTSFRQVYFNPEKLRENADVVLAETSAALREGKEVQGHSTLLPGSMNEATPAQVASFFGSGFANALQELPVGEWKGPVESALGWHFVQVESRQPGVMPPFEQIRDRAAREWEHDQRNAFREQFDRELLEKYEVTVEWPNTEDPAG